MTVTTAPATRRGTSNTNERGNVKDRLRRRQYLVERFRADTDLCVTFGLERWVIVPADFDPRAPIVPACRCFRCGTLLHAGVTTPDGTVIDSTVTSDRIKPGCEGGTYRRDNLRPACGGCQSRDGGLLGAERRRVGSS